MTKEEATYRRVLRRETHAPRTAPATVVAAIGIVLLLALLVAGAWWLVDGGFRAGAVRWLDGLALQDQPQVVPFGAGAVVVVLSLVLLALAVLPGRRARRARMTERTALLVDDGVIADSIAEAVARRVRVERSRVAVTVGRRTVAVRITPTSGIPVDRSAAESAVDDTLVGIGFTATPRVLVEANGVIA
ncbi:hypothetical protein [Microbacterium sp. MYb62]|uniref:hypothetical protein n=1 Tax=Microbacterium sp. MYb62 TaxID=1848690 RepID=UPI000CFC5C17|nr:hypothetical protein [Microbacterium sp. MYb62]PRB16091.1 hypothetical protein CQ042_08220 [Microbacterium sp. MYb62]